MRASTVLPICLLAVLPAPAAAQSGDDPWERAPIDSIVAWTERLRAGTIREKARAAGRLEMQAGGRLSPETGAVAVAELRRIDEAMLRGRAVPGRSELAREAFDEYRLSLASIAARFDAPEADRALVLSIGVSRALRERAAALGDAAVPTLAEMVRRGLSASAAIETLALAWFWADSTRAPLSEESRRTILRAMVSVGRDDDQSRRSSAASALGLTKDAAFLPYARTFERRERRNGRAALADVVRNMAIDTLRRRADAASAVTLAERSRRVLRLICADGGPAVRRDACRSVADEFDAALRHLRVGRTRRARTGLHAVIRRANQAHRTGAITQDEHALIAGGALQVVERL